MANLTQSRLPLHQRRRALMVAMAMTTLTVAQIQTRVGGVRLSLDAKCEKDAQTDNV